MSEPATLTEHHGALSLFAEAITGLALGIDPVDHDTATWPLLPTDPSADRVVAPAELSTRRDFRTIVLHQVMALAERQATPVSVPAMTRHHRWLPFVFSVLEDLRVDRLTRTLFPGAARDLDGLLARTRAQIDLGGLPSALAALRRRGLGDDGPHDAAVQRAAARVERAGATLQDSMQAAIRFCSRLDEHGEWLASDELDAPADDAEGETSGGGSADDDAVVTEVETTDGLAGGSPIDDDASMAGLDTEDPESEGDTELDDANTAPSLLGDRSVGTDPDRRRTFVYDEWDFRQGRHLPAWCRLLEERLVGDDGDFIVDVRRRHAALRAEIRRRLARLRDDDLLRVHRCEDGEELDLDAVIVAIGDRRAGAPADDRLRVRRDRAARDVATALLVDLSASTSSPVVAPEPAAPQTDDVDDLLAPMWELPPEPLEPPRRVIDVAKDAVALLSDALDELGDRHAVYGFSGTGRHEVEFAVVKEFADRVSAPTWGAIAAMRPLRYTRMGPAIRHAAAKLGAEAARTRLLIVISDGYPQDVDYGHDARDREHGLYDTARALADAQRSGIDTFCITIDPAGHDYLREMCPDRRYLVINDIESLPAELAKVYIALRH